MKKYSVLRRIWDNVEMTVGLSLAMMVVREIKQGRNFMRGIAEKYFWRILAASCYSWEY